MSTEMQAPRRLRDPLPAALVRKLLLAGAIVLLLLRFVHLSADFPNDSSWLDWAKYTDEGWYGDAAIRHFQLGHWYVKGDFNPAVVLPVWPLMEAALFRITGVNLLAARALALVTFFITLLALLRLMEQFPVRERARDDDVPLAAPIAVFLLACSSFTYVFSRMAILEAPLLMFVMLVLLAATRLRAGEGWRKQVARSLWLGFLLCVMVLTKTTGIALLPGIIYLLWFRARYRFRAFCKLAVTPLLVASLLWAAYFVLLVKPRFLEDFRYLFVCNSYISFQNDPLAVVLASTFAHGTWIGAGVYGLFALSCVFLLATRPLLLRNPLIASFFLMIAGYLFFLAYHNSFQPRYYLVPAVPMTAIAAYALDAFRFPVRNTVHRVTSWKGVSWRTWVVAALVLAVALPELALQGDFLLHPQYTFLHGAQAVARVIRANPGQSPLLLSISGSDVSLMTGIPSINDDYGTLDLDERARLYRPGWYLAWNLLEDDKMDALFPAFRPVRVLTIPALDDPERNQMILYRLDPGPSAQESPETATSACVGKATSAKASWKRALPAAGAHAATPCQETHASSSNPS